LYLPLLVGAQLLLVGSETARDGRALAQAMARFAPTLMQATPATWRMLLEAGWRGDRQLTLLCGGEALPRDLAERLLACGAALWNLYGPTETTIWSTVQRVTSGAGAVPIGRPIANTQCYVLDRAQQLVPIGVPGELSIGGAGVAEGYLRRPELTAERFLPDPFAGAPGARLYRTGDLVRYRADGALEYLGRLDQQVKVRGFRIELGEIEAVLRAQPGVRAATVSARPDAVGEHELLAYVVPDAPAAPPGVAALRAALAAQLPGYMVPAAFVMLAALPLTPNGKIDRHALPAAATAVDALPPVGETDYVAPRTPLEEILAEIWAEILEVERVGVTDDFFELGGHSLLAARSIARVRDALGVELSLRTFFQRPTISALAAVIAEQQAGSAERDEVAQLLAEIDSLSDSEVAARLAAHEGR
jgi:acyl-CoA synthetase (AMP-forming)/AMP-acid ligase II/acyl carrier protein